MKYGIHIACDVDSDVIYESVEAIMFFKTDEEFDNYNQFCEVYDNGASHRLIELDYPTYEKIKRAGEDAMLEKFKKGYKST